MPVQGAPIRILTITNWFPPHHFGGYELLCHDTMVRLVEHGHDVRILCADTVVPDAAAPTAALEEATHRELRLYHTGDALLAPPIRQRLAIERHNQRALRRLLAEERPDVVSAWHFGALSLGLLTTVAEAGIPIAYNICDDWLIYGTKLDRWASLFTGSPLQRALGRMVRPVAGVPTVVPDLGPSGVALHISEQSALRARGAALWAFRAEAVVYSGIEADLYSEPAEPGPRPWQGRLICTGRFDPRKGQETLVRALPLLPDVVAAFWGRGGEHERARLEALAAELDVGKQATFGSLHREQLNEAFRHADAMVFPSTWPEPFGLTPLEAMACGVPVVATAVGGSAEYLVDGRNCLWFEPGDPAALAAAVERLAGDAALRAALIEGGRRTAADLTMDHLGDELERWHQWAADGFVGAPPPPRHLAVERVPACRLVVVPQGATISLAASVEHHDGDRRAARFEQRQRAASSEVPPHAGSPIDVDLAALPFHALPDRVLVDAAAFPPADLDRLLASLAALATARTRVQVRLPSRADPRRFKSALRRWYGGDHRPVVPPAGARVPSEGFEPPAPWRVQHLVPAGFGPSPLGRVAQVVTAPGRGRWAPAVVVELALQPAAGSDSG